jgi:hypothetical protein
MNFLPPDRDIFNSRPKIYPNTVTIINGICMRKIAVLISAVILSINISAQNIILTQPIKKPTGGEISTGF